MGLKTPVWLAGDKNYLPQKFFSDFKKTRLSPDKRFCYSGR
jgi:hypothetical protein